MNFILAAGILIIAGYFGGLAARKIRFPRITGYLVIGMILSPSLLNIIPKGLIQGELTIITEIALGIIAYLVGGNLELKALKTVGKSVFSITLLEANGAWFVVTLLITFLMPLFIRMDISKCFYMAIVIGAISCATAPAATLAVIHEYKAKGPLTTTLLDVVALDDAFAIIAYSIAIAIVGVLAGGVASSPLVSGLVEIFGSLALGGALGFGLVWLARYIQRRQMLLVVVSGMILLAVGLAKPLGLSSLLSCMAIGFVVVNWLPHPEQLFGVVNDIEDLVFAVFFTLAGTHFDLAALKIGGILALLMLGGRFAGKYWGARFGATVSRSPETVRKYTGLGLLPQAGVAIGLVLLVKQIPALSEMASLMVNAVLAQVILNELIAPPLTKYALFKAGEARE